MFGETSLDDKQRPQVICAQGWEGAVVLTLAGDVVRGENSLTEWREWVARSAASKDKDAGKNQRIRRPGFDAPIRC